MLRDFFSGRFHVRVFDSGTYLLSAVVVDSFFVIDLPSFSRLQVSFWKGRETTFFESCDRVRLRSEISSFYIEFPSWTLQIADTKVELSRGT
jgi:hypothetical protein